MAEIGGGKCDRQDDDFLFGPLLFVWILLSLFVLLCSHNYPGPDRRPPGACMQWCRS